MKSAIRIIAFLAVICASAMVVAQQPQPAIQPAAASKAPAIPAGLLKRFWQADSAQQRAQQQLQAAQSAQKSAGEEWTSAIKAMVDACGDKFQIKQDMAGQDPYCGLKPEAPKPVEAPKK